MANYNPDAHFGQSFSLRPVSRYRTVAIWTVATDIYSYIFIMKINIFSANDIEIVRKINCGPNKKVGKVG
jgi:hypothetical protein